LAGEDDCPHLVAEIEFHEYARDVGLAVVMLAKR
jgi:hypothetical protein